VRWCNVKDGLRHRIFNLHYISHKRAVAHACLLPTNSIHCHRFEQNLATFKSASSKRYREAIHALGFTHNRPTLLDYLLTYMIITLKAHDSTRLVITDECSDEALMFERHSATPSPPMRMRLIPATSAINGINSKFPTAKALQF
jgi:hypothetical protein